MVLEDGTASKDSFEVGAPPSDDDAYGARSSRHGGPARFSTENIDLQALPRPFPIIGPLMGYNNKFLLKTLNMKAGMFANVLGRSPTEEESNAMAFWTAKQVSIYSYGSPLGIMGGGYRAWTTASQFKFPFFQPDLETFPKYKFPPTEGLGLLRGNRAFVAWHALRFLAYGSVGAFIGQALLGAYSMSVVAVGEVTDPRLKEYVEILRKKARMNGPPGATRTPRNRNSAGTEPADGEIQSAELTALGQNSDDASPTGGYSWNDSEESDEKPAQPTPTRRLPYQRFRSQPQPTVDTADSEAGQPFDVFDNASPTGGRGVDLDDSPRARQEGSPSLGGGSAWERIRKDSAPDAHSTTTRPTTWGSLRTNTSNSSQDDYSPTTDGYSPSLASSSSSSTAREQAQRSFDAEVERERRGGTFGGGSGGGGSGEKRW